MNVRSPKNNETTAIIVGGGIAGAATAFFLSREPGFRVRILEKEEAPGQHATGRNAAMVRRLVSPRWLADLAADGADFIDAWADQSDGSGVSRCGGLIAGAPKDLAALKRASEGRFQTVAVSASEVGRHAPFFGRHSHNHDGLLTPGDGVVDVASLLEHLLQGARANGAELLCGTGVEGVQMTEGKLTGVHTSRGLLAGDILVNAAGPWAGTLARTIGATPIEMIPRKRHLHWTGPLDTPPIDAAYFWDVTHGFYIRPESGGLLLCACEEREEPPGDARPDADATELLFQKLLQHTPWLSELPIARTWAGLRTFSSDSNFVIGWDPTLKGVYWVAGLGGHGITTCGAVGRLAAKELAQGQSDRDDCISPSRFLP